MCDNGETNASCPADCPASSCGNGVCDNGESNATCPADCQIASTCPSSIEACAFCAVVGQLCPPGNDQDSCIQCIIGGGGTGCSGGFPDLVCTPPETAATCPFDCM